MTCSTSQSEILAEPGIEPRAAELGYSALNTSLSLLRIRDSVLPHIQLSKDSLMSKEERGKEENLMFITCIVEYNWSQGEDLWMKRQYNDSSFGWAV